jgi:hypothetical protein
MKEGGHVLIEERDDEDFFNPEIERNAILLQTCLVGGGEVGSRIAEEVREVYYTRNTFEVRSHSLKKFLWDRLAHDRAESVDHLIGWPIRLPWLRAAPRPLGSLFGNFSPRGARSKGDQQPDGRVAHNQKL